MFSYKPHFIPSSIILIGAGGTGSRLMNTLPQLVKTCLNKFNPAAWILNLPIFVIDGDEVEEKNLVRQNFIQKDVGLNKAVVVANRYSNAYGVPIYASNKYLKPDEGYPIFIGYSGNSTTIFNNAVVILAVDSAQARREILQFLFQASVSSGTNNNLFIIDAGNEDDFGQVRFFTNVIWDSKAPNLSNEREAILSSIPRECPVEVVVDHIPMDLEYYNTLGSSAAEISCEDLPQSLAINNMMAALICSVVQNFLYVKPMSYDGIRYSLNGSMVTEYNTAFRWLKRTTPAFSYLWIGDGPYDPVEGTFVYRYNTTRLHYGPTQSNLYSTAHPTQKLIKEVRSFASKMKMVVENRTLVPIPAEALGKDKAATSKVTEPPKVKDTPVVPPLEQVVSLTADALVTAGVDTITPTAEIPPLEPVRPPRRTAARRPRTTAQPE